MTTKKTTTVSDLIAMVDDDTLVRLVALLTGSKTNPVAIKKRIAFVRSLKDTYK